jgi:hypothetical protein
MYKCLSDGTTSKSFIILHDMINTSAHTPHYRILDTVMFTNNVCFGARFTHLSHSSGCCAHAHAMSVSNNATPYIVCSYATN